MSNSDSTPGGADWEAAQRQFLDAFLSMGGASPSASGGSAASWQRALDMWWQLAAGAGEPDQQVVLRQVYEQSRVFIALAEHLARMSTEMSSAGKESDEWREIMDRHLQEMQEYFAADGKTAGAAAPGSAWRPVMDMWQQAAAAAAGFSGDGGAPADLANRFLSMPAFGPGRKAQERLQQGGRLWNTYQEKLNAYQAALSRQSVAALQLLRERLLALAETGNTLSSLRDFYDLWVDCSEESFAHYAFTDEYSMLYGEMVNSLMEFRRHGQSLAEEVYRTLDLPGPAGMSTLQRRQQELRRQARNAAAQQQRLVAEVARLQSQIETLQPSAASAGKTKKRTKRSGGKRQSKGRDT